MPGRAWWFESTQGHTDDKNTALVIQVVFSFPGIGLGSSRSTETLKLNLFVMFIQHGAHGAQHLLERERFREKSLRSQGEDFLCLPLFCITA